ncbi:MAG: hypothetical protein ACI39F_06510 [Acutalibacteraceae bacterium]
MNKFKSKNMEKNNIKIKITTVSSNNPVNVIKGSGVLREGNGKSLLTHTDNENTKTSVIITEDKVLLCRSSNLYSLKIPVKQGETLLGIMGEESTFTVIGKTAEYTRDNKGGNIEIEYNLPDLADEALDFKVTIDFKFEKGK